MDELTNVKFELFLMERDTSKNSGHGKAVFVVGGPGSGKDHIIRGIMDRYNLLECSLSKLNNYYKSGTDDAKLSETLKKGFGVIVNSSGDSLASTKETKVMLESFGYDTMMVYVHVDEDVSIARVSGRKKSLSESTCRSKWVHLNEMKSWFKRMFTNFYEVDNSQDRMLNENVEDPTMDMMGVIDNFIKEEVSIQITASTPKEMADVIRSLKVASEPERDDVKESDERPDATDLLTLGKDMPIQEVSTDSHTITNAQVSALLEGTSFVDKIRGVMESIDGGIEPGLSMASGGENACRKAEKKTPKRIMDED